MANKRSYLFPTLQLGSGGTCRVTVNSECPEAMPLTSVGQSQLVEKGLPLGVSFGFKRAGKLWDMMETELETRERKA